MVEALDKKGIPVAYSALEGEQHGFRRAENIKRALDAELYFYGRIFGFEPADAIEPVVIRKPVGCSDPGAFAPQRKSRGHRPAQSARVDANPLPFRMSDTRRSALRTLSGST